METGLNAYIKQQFDLDRDVDIRTVSPLTLAYIGDGIYELVIRSVMVARTNSAATAHTGGRECLSSRA